MSKKPFLLTMGDPAGIGPEIAVRALSNNQNHQHNIVVVGDVDVLTAAAQMCKLNVRFNVVDENFNNICNDDSQVINVLNIDEITMKDFTPRIAQASCGRAAYNYIIKAIELTLNKRASGVITNPISKESLKLAGINYPGHTEIFADKTNTTDYSMVFLLDNVAVAHVTTHVSLRDAINMITKDRVLQQIKLLNRSLKNLSAQSQKIAVGGLNPHAGENGLFGNEEIQEIIPAIETARADGIDVIGPLPPDTVFCRAFGGEFGGVVSMLHDHGFVALKSRDFDRGVNITVGLPIIRTSVGHGTAFDKAWFGGDNKNVSCESLHSAIHAAFRL